LSLASLVSGNTLDAVISAPCVDTVSCVAADGWVQNALVDIFTLALVSSKREAGAALALVAALEVGAGVFTASVVVFAFIDINALAAIDRNNGVSGKTEADYSLCCLTAEQVVGQCLTFASAMGRHIVCSEDRLGRYVTLLALETLWA
jgi:hypothetical protein